MLYCMLAATDMVQRLSLLVNAPTSFSGVAGNCQIYSGCSSSFRVGVYQISYLCWHLLLTLHWSHSDFLDYGHAHILHAQFTNPTSCATALSSGNWRNISVISQAGVESACYGRRNEGAASRVRSVSWLHDVGMPNPLVWRSDIVHWFHCKLETAGVDASFMGSCPGLWLKMIFVHWVD